MNKLDIYNILVHIKAQAYKMRSVSHIIYGIQYDIIKTYNETYYTFWWN